MQYYKNGFQSSWIIANDTKNLYVPNFLFTKTFRKASCGAKIFYAALLKEVARVATTEEFKDGGNIFISLDIPALESETPFTKEEIETFLTELEKSELIEYKDDNTIHLLRP